MGMNGGRKRRHLSGGPQAAVMSRIRQKIACRLAPTVDGVERPPIHLHPDIGMGAPIHRLPFLFSGSLQAPGSGDKGPVNMSPVVLELRK